MVICFTPFKAVYHVLTLTVTVVLEQLRTATAQLLSGTTPASEEGVQQRERMARKPIMKAKIVRMILEEE